MKLFQAMFDTSLITLIAEDKQDAISIIHSDENNYLKKLMFIEDDKLFIKWTESFTEEIIIEPVENKRGIIQYESH